MLVLTKTQPASKLRPQLHSKRVSLSDGRHTTIHVARYRRQQVRAKLVLFEEETLLQAWCQANNVAEAINAGYFIRASKLPLGECWLNGRVMPSEPYSHGWNGRRGSVYLPANDVLNIGPRQQLAPQPDGDLIEIGPTLVHQGLSSFLQHPDPEGFEQTVAQHDDSLNGLRHPRAGIGHNDTYIWTVSADGRTTEDAGLYLQELAEVFCQLGATEAVNLDGGSSTSHISGGQLINAPRGTLFNPRRTNHAFERIGRPIFSALIFQATDIIA